MQSCSARTCKYGKEKHSRKSGAPFALSLFPDICRPPFALTQQAVAAQRATWDKRSGFDDRARQPSSKDILAEYKEVLKRLQGRSQRSALSSISVESNSWLTRVWVNYTVKLAEMESSCLPQQQAGMAQS
jgi:hypothetical protein